MKSTKDGETDVSAPAASDDEFDRLRDTFYARLRSDRIRLTTLAAALARVEGNPADIFQALQGLAHRIRGAAAVFEASELGDAASALEHAATSAWGNCADHANGAVWSALEELVDRLAMAGETSVATAGDFRPILHLSGDAKRTGEGPRNVKYRQTKRR